MAGWPWPGDSPLARARRVAIAYRTHLHAARPDLCDELDATMRGFGEVWVVPTVITSDSEWLTPEEAASWLGISLAGVRQLRLRGRLTGIKGTKGWRYRLADVSAVVVAPRQRKPRVDHDAA